MANPKPNSAKRRRNPPTESSKGDGSPPKKHLGLAKTLMILVPFVLVFAFLVWTAINQYIASNPLAPESPSSDASLATDSGAGLPKGAGDPATESDPESIGVVWETKADRDQKWNQVDDASADGWETEEFTRQATAQLDRIKKILLHPDQTNVESLTGIATDDVESSPLRPENLQPVYEDATLVVRRSDPRAAAPAALRGQAALADALQKFVQPWPDPEQLRIKIKIFNVRPIDGRITETRQTVEMFGQSQDGLLEENLTWIARWQNAEAGQLPRLASLAADQYEGVRHQGDVMFSDCTRSVLNDCDSFESQLMTGYDYWLEQGQFREFFVTTGNPGIAIGDVNNDGLEDIYVCQESGLPNLLFLQNADGSVHDVSREGGADWLQNSRTALIVDFDNDGNNDLAVAVTGGVVIASGDGTGCFSIRTVLDTSDDIVVLTTADYDLDGRLDLFAGAYYADKSGGTDQELPVGSSGGSFVYVDSNDGGANSLHRNAIADGSWQFDDVTNSSGLNVNNRRYTQAGAWPDFDGDGDADLYLANDYGKNNLYRNDRLADGSRVFVDIANQAGVEDSASGMSVAWGDYDRDGWTDLYVSNMYSYAGNRIMFQDQFKPGESEDLKQQFRRFARGNSFFRNQGPPADANPWQFDDLSVQAGVNRGRWAWGSRFVDLNNDGWEDLVVANGYITADDTGDL